MSQALITPVICRLGHEGSALLLENAELLDRLGFTAESFGDGAVAVRRIPAEIDLDGVEPALSDIAAALSRGGTPEPAKLDGIYKTVACKAAIKAGRSSEPRELEELAGKVMSGAVSQCPHGRPVAFELTKTALDKSFRRI
jgi:DNA mismatch repair protein MutL